MVNVFRKHQSILMPAFAIFAIVAFVWFYNGQAGNHNASGEGSTENYVEVYGRNYSIAEAKRIGRIVHFDPDGRSSGLAQTLRLKALLRSINSDHSQESDPIINYIVLKHEADALQILATDDEVKAYITQLPILQTDGHFDPAKYQRLTENVLGPFGFTIEDLFDTIRDEVRAEKLLSLVSSSAETSPDEVKTLYTQQYQKVDAEIIRFSLANSEAGVHISDEEAAKVFAQRKDSFKSEELRRVKLVKFSLSDADQKLSGKERIEALQNLANRANDFSVAMTNANADFDKTAGKFGAKVEETGDFAVSHPDKLIAAEPKLLAAAFNLKTDQPNSDPIATTGGYTILRLVNVIPSKPLTFAEAKPQVIAQLTQEHAQQLLATQAADVRKKIEASLTAKKSFAEAAQEAGQKAETVPPFSLADHASNLPDAEVIFSKALTLKTGELSDFIPTADGGLLVYVANREPIDETKFEKAKPMLTELVEEHKQLLIFGDWLQRQRLDAKVKYAQQNQ